MQNIQSIGIVGAGQMGRGIAQVAAMSGYTVQIFDVSPEGLKKGVDFIEAQLKKGVEKRKAIQVEWSNTNSQLHGFIEGSSDFIAALDLDFNFIAFNTMYQKEILRLFHIDLKTGMNFSTLLNRMNDKNREKATKQWMKAFEGNSFTVVETFDDERFSDLIFEIHYNPIRNEQNVLIGASHIATNVYERIQNDLKIMTAKKRLEILVTSLENQNKELTFLKEMINILQGSLSLQDTIQPLKTYIKKILINSSGVIYLAAKDDPDMWHEMLSWGTSKIHSKTVHKSDCWALMRNQVHSCLQADDDLICQHVSSSKKKKPGYLCLPMQAQSETLGLFYTEIIHKDPLDTKRIINLSQIMAEQIALSFFNIQLQEELKNQSAHDSLTGLYNRRFFEEYIKKEFYKSERDPRTFALLLIDIDFFKKINDSHGHLIGDHVLKAIANELFKNCRKSDLVCRWGGEEFLLF
ncbi:MAG: diguanylate cyclase, partial [Silvanigrellaceae bacterium]|nr:diguanylate cyclase [Silvanigrellaceae bacterium]